jgi:hypothetical protein
LSWQGETLPKFVNGFTINPAAQFYASRN